MAFWMSLDFSVVFPQFEIVPEFAQHCCRDHKLFHSRTSKSPKVNDQWQNGGEIFGINLELHFQSHRKLFEFPLLDYFRQTNKFLANFLLHTSLRVVEGVVVKEGGHANVTETNTSGSYMCGY